MRNNVLNFSKPLAWPQEATTSVLKNETSYEYYAQPGVMTIHLSISRKKVK